MQAVLFSLAAIVTLLPASVAAVLRRERGRDGLYWLLLGLAVAGPMAFVVNQMSSGWKPTLPVALWITITATMALFALVAVSNRNAWRLTALVGPYMVLLGLGATIWHQAGSGDRLAGDPASGWLLIHIALAVITYGLATLAALAAFSAFLQERALKRKAPTALTRLLPSVADSEGLLVRLLTAAEVVLGLGLATGMASLFAETGHLLSLDHKTVLTILAFVVIGLLLFAHHRTGMRGRRATRLVLIGYLLFSLGTLGVKFVTEVLLTGHA